MGYEGEISAIYWDGVKALLGEDIFGGRITYGATDTINSALNYGYAILYGRAQKALVKAGLALHISFLHSSDGRKPTLVFDFVEEFRAYVADYRDWETDRKSTRLNSSHRSLSRMPSSA